MRKLRFYKESDHRWYVDLPEIVYGEDRNYFAPCEIPIYEKLYLELGT